MTIAKNTLSGCMESWISLILQKLFEDIPHPTHATAVPPHCHASGLAQYIRLRTTQDCKLSPKKGTEVKVGWKQDLGMQNVVGFIKGLFLASRMVAPYNKTPDNPVWCHLLVLRGNDRPHPPHMIGTGHQLCTCAGPPVSPVW